LSSTIGSELLDEALDLLYGLADKVAIVLTPLSVDLVARLIIHYSRLKHRFNTVTVLNTCTEFNSVTASSTPF
jgi:hypothetical protein